MEGGKNRGGVTPTSLPMTSNGSVPSRGSIGTNIVAHVTASTCITLSCAPYSTERYVTIGYDKEVVEIVKKTLRNQ